MIFRSAAVYALTAILLASSLSQAAGRSFLVPSPSATFNLKNSQLMYQNNPEFKEDYDGAKKLGYRHLDVNWGNPDSYVKTAYLMQNDALHTAAVAEYIWSLNRQKSKLMAIYKLRNQTYNKLAAMAFGVFGVESKFGTHWKYAFKEKNQALVSTLKSLTGSGDATNSRGLTQMKHIPEKIQKNYPEITPETLYDAEYAAVATVGYLAEAFVMLKGLRDNQIKEGVKAGAVNLSYMTDENIFDYIPYVYSGRMRMIFNGPKGAQGATVTDNLYIKEMKQHMSHLYFMEK